MSVFTDLQAANVKLQADTRAAATTKRAFAALAVWAADVEKRLAPPPSPASTVGQFGTSTFGDSNYG